MATRERDELPTAQADVVVGNGDGLGWIGIIEDGPSDLSTTYKDTLWSDRNEPSQ